MDKRGAKALVVLASVAGLLVGVGIWFDGRRQAETAVTQEALPRYEPVDQTRPIRLAVIGDELSYQQPDSPQAPWPTLLTRERGWYLRSQATPGTGYVAGGKLSFIDRVAGATSNNPDLIIVAGGSEDESDPRPVQVRASGLYADLKRVAPDAKIVVVGPIGTSPNPSPGLRAVNDQVRSASKAAGIEFVEALDWLAAPGLTLGDGRTTADGDQLLTERIAAAVPDLGAVPA